MRSYQTSVLLVPTNTRDISLTMRYSSRDIKIHQSRSHKSDKVQNFKGSLAGDMQTGTTARRKTDNPLWRRHNQKCLSLEVLRNHFHSRCKAMLRHQSQDRPSLHTMWPAQTYPGCRQTVCWSETATLQSRCLLHFVVWLRDLTPNPTRDAPNKWR